MFWLGMLMVASAMESVFKSSHCMVLIAFCFNTRKHLALVQKKSCAKLTCAATHKHEALL